MKVTDEQIKRLKEAEGDSEEYHSVFDNILEEYLAELDSEWITEMLEIYKKSGESRWYA